LSLLIRAGERAAFIGLPGSGKTNLEMNLLEGVGSVGVLDAKHDPEEWAAYGRGRGYVVTAEEAPLKREARVVYQVDQLALEDRQGWGRPGSRGFHWTMALAYLFSRGSVVVVFADALQLLPSSGGNPQARRILTQGRSRRVTSFLDIQRPKWVDTLALKLCEHAFCFKTIDADDLVELQRARGVDPTPLRELQPFHFGYHRFGSQEWVICPPVRKIVGVKKGGRKPAAKSEKGLETGKVPPLTEAPDPA
jgi:DNA helicase HerA-like ATPase